MSNSFATPWTRACQAPLSMGFPRQEYWSGLLFPSPGDLPNPGMEQHLLHWQVDSLPLSHQESLSFMLFSAICSLDVVKICLFVFCVCVKSFISKNLPPVLPALHFHCLPFAL